MTFLAVGILLAVCGVVLGNPDLFSAGSTSSWVTSTKDIVVFDRIFAGDSFIYDPATGVVTVDLDGFYFFTFSGIPLRNGTIWLDLYKNEEYQISAYGFTGTALRQSQASNSIILKLTSGDTVTIRFHGDKERTAFGANNEIFLTFSGFKL